MFNLAELNRKLEGMLVFASITELDESARKFRATVDTDDGDQISGWLPWPAEIGRNYIRWRPLRLQCQVLLACPSGNLANAQMLGMLYSQAQSSPSDNPDIDLITFNDGTSLKYDIANHKLTGSVQGSVELSSTSQISLSAPEINLAAENNLNMSASQLNIIAETGIDGAVTQTGGDITSDGIGVQGHHHTNEGLLAPTSEAQQ